MQVQLTLLNAQRILYSIKRLWITRQSNPQGYAALNTKSLDTSSAAVNTLCGKIACSNAPLLSCLFKRPEANIGTISPQVEYLPSRTDALILLTRSCTLNSSRYRNSKCRPHAVSTRSLTPEDVFPDICRYWSIPMTDSQDSADRSRWE